MGGRRASGGGRGQRDREGDQGSLDRGDAGGGGRREDHGVQGEREDHVRGRDQPLSRTTSGAPVFWQAPFGSATPSRPSAGTLPLRRAAARLPRGLRRGAA